MAEIVLRTEDLTRRYGDVLAVDGLCIDVAEGEVLGLLGPNGAGKTTTIHMLCGLLDPHGGKVLLRGEDVTQLGDWRSRVGLCPQEIVLWPRLTAIEQLVFIGRMTGMARAAARQRGDALLVALGLAEKRDTQARRLSGGMQRRLNLAMALVHDPELVVLDEPEAGLDPQSRVRVREFIRSLARRRTVLVSTHNMDEAERVADRVAIIDRGKLLALDTPDALKKRLGDAEIVEVHPDGGDLGAARRALEPLADEVDDDGLVITLRVSDGVVALPRVREALAAADCEPGEIRVRNATLEDVFLQLTGRRLRE
jgi:ABC-2 type transport system ATP-binding protein